MRGIRGTEPALPKTSRNMCVFDTAVLVYHGIWGRYGVHDTSEGSFEVLMEDDGFLVRLEKLCNHRQERTRPPWLAGSNFENVK